MIDELRQLADGLDKATPGPWESLYNNTLVGVGKSTVCALYPASDAWRSTNASAICLARNECPAALREAADEIERLQRVVEQAIELGGLGADGDGWVYSREFSRLRAHYPDLAVQLECQRGEK